MPCLFPGQMGWKHGDTEKHVQPEKRWEKPEVILVSTARYPVRSFGELIPDDQAIQGVEGCKTVHMEGARQ